MGEWLSSFWLRLAIVYYDTSAGSMYGTIPQHLFARQTLLSVVTSKYLHCCKYESYRQSILPDIKPVDLQKRENKP